MEGAAGRAARTARAAFASVAALPGGRFSGRVRAAWAASALLLILCLFTTSCRKERGASLFPSDCHLAEGDLLFRRGCGLSSQAVMMADRSGHYSHVGIVVDSAGTKMVVHAVPDEPDFKGDPDRVKMETPEQFYLPTKARAGAVVRVRCRAEEARIAAEFARKAYAERVLFDHAYDDEDSTKMYCCELVVRAYRRAGISLAENGKHELRMPGLERIKCILPSDIAGNGRVEHIASF